MQTGAIFQLGLALAGLVAALVFPGFGGDIEGKPSQEHAPGEQGMTKLLSVPFNPGRPKLSPEDEDAIHAGTMEAAFRDAVRNPAVTLVVVGYIERATHSAEDQQTAFRRAQLVADVLRDKCGVGVNCQAMTFETAKLPASERRGKERLVEVWVANP